MEGALFHFLPSQRGQRKKAWNACGTVWTRCVRGFGWSPIRERKFFGLGTPGEVTIMNNKLFLFAEEERILSWIRRRDVAEFLFMEAKWRRRYSK
jgi:hypothetical protein